MTNQPFDGMIIIALRIFEHLDEECNSHHYLNQTKQIFNQSQSHNKTFGIINELCEEGAY
jgi:hypothetical protein